MAAKIMFITTFRLGIELVSVGKVMLVDGDVV